MTKHYKTASEFMNQLEMREAKLWPGEKPDGPIEVKGPFGSRNMAFEQWLAWIFIPRVRQIVAEQGSFPDSSSVAAYAVREFDTTPGAREVLDVLGAFDRFINQSKKR